MLPYLLSQASCGWVRNSGLGGARDRRGTTRYIVSLQLCKARGDISRFARNDVQENQADESALGEGVEGGAEAFEAGAAGAGPEMAKSPAGGAQDAAVLAPEQQSRAMEQQRVAERR